MADHQGWVTLKRGDGTVLTAVPFTDDGDPKLTPTDIQNAYETLEGSINPNDSRLQGVDLSDATVVVEEAPEHSPFDMSSFSWEREKSNPVLATTAFHSSSVLKLFQAPLRALTQDEKYTNEKVVDATTGQTETIPVIHAAWVMASFGNPSTDEAFTVSLTQQWNQGRGANAYKVFEGDNGQIFRIREAGFASDKQGAYEVQKADGTWATATPQTVLRTGVLPGKGAVSVGAVDGVPAIDRSRHIQTKATQLFTEELVGRHMNDKGEIDLKAVYQEVDSDAFNSQTITVSYSFNDQMQQFSLQMPRAAVTDYLESHGYERPETVAQADVLPPPHHPKNHHDDGGKEPAAGRWGRAD